MHKTIHSPLVNRVQEMKSRCLQCLHTLYVLFSRLLAYRWSSVLTSFERLQSVYSPLELSELGNPWHTWVAL